MVKNSDNPLWHSSYEENNYGALFYSLIHVYQPEKVVELARFLEIGWCSYPWLVWRRYCKFEE